MLSPDKLTNAFAKVEEENWLLRGFLKEQSPNQVDKIVNRLHQEVFSKIDCSACSNCCKKIVPILEEKDIQRISSKIGLTSDEYKDKFLVADDDGLGIKEKPCPHLGENGCSIYEYRPRICREYPFTDQKRTGVRLINLIENCSVCPAVFEIFERIKRYYKVEFAEFKDEQQIFSWGGEGDDLCEEFEEWEVESEFFDKEDWAGLVQYRYSRVKDYPEQFEYQWSLGEAYVLNKEYEKAIFYLYPLHKKHPEDPNVQHSLLDAVFAMGKDETAINWIVQPTILRLNAVVLNLCYRFLKGKRKPRTVEDVYLELLCEGYLTFDANQLMMLLLSDNRFSVTVGNEKSYDSYVKVSKNR